YVTGRMPVLPSAPVHGPDPRLSFSDEPQTVAILDAVYPYRTEFVQLSRPKCARRGTRAGSSRVQAVGRTRWATEHGFHVGIFRHCAALRVFGGPRVAQVVDCRWHRSLECRHRADRVCDGAAHAAAVSVGGGRGRGKLRVDQPGLDL